MITGTTGHALLIRRYTIETVGINKRHKPIKPMTLSDLTAAEGQSGAQLLQDLPLNDNLDPEARLETLTDGRELVTPG